MPRSPTAEIAIRCLHDDVAFHAFVGDGTAWLCPACLALIELATEELPEAILPAILTHLDGCEAFRTNHLIDHSQRRDVQRHHDISFRLRADPAWQVHDETGRWVCPGCLGTIPVDRSDTDSMRGDIDEHIRQCVPLVRQGVQPTPIVRSAAGSLPAELGTRAQWLADPATSRVLAQATQADLDAARLLQLDLMGHPPRVPGFRFATFYEACASVSGDFNQFVPREDGSLLFAQGDVSGHGVQAGLLMAVATKLIELYGRQYGDPCQTAIQIHRAMAGDLGGRHFLSLAVCLLDPATRILRWVRAGHTPALHYQAASATVSTLLPNGMVVGLPVNEAFTSSLELSEIQLAPGDCMVFYTDGLTETLDAAQEEFGHEALSAVVKRHAAEGPDRLLAQILATVDEHRAKARRDDDLSLIILSLDTP